MCSSDLGLVVEVERSGGSSCGWCKRSLRDHPDAAVPVPAHFVVVVAVGGRRQVDGRVLAKVVAGVGVIAGSKEVFPVEGPFRILGDGLPVFDGGLPEAPLTVDTKLVLMLPKCWENLRPDSRCASSGSPRTPQTIAESPCKKPVANTTASPARS